MKILRVVISLIIFFSLSYGDIPLTGKWLFKTGSDSSWARADYDDSLWTSILVPAYWENQGYKDYDGYGWYRYHLSLDSTICRMDSLILILGKIDDIDETYFNGEKIGATGSFPPEYVTGRNLRRKYIIPRKLLRNQNVLAVKVFDSGKDGGLYRGPLKIMLPETTAPPEIKRVKLNSTYFQIPYTNGISAANYDIISRTFNSFYPHIYQKFDDKTPTKLVINSARAILFKGENEIPLTSLTQVDAGYVENTGIVKHILSGKDFVLTQYAFCPFSLDKPFWIFFVVLEANDISNYSLNFDINTQNNQIAQINIGKWAYQKDRIKWLMVFIYYNPEESTNSYSFIMRYKNEHPGFTALLHEIDSWKKWHKNTLLPPRLTSDEKRLYYQSLCTIKMAQCREGFPSHGQILASLPPSSLNYTWVQDQAYSINALLYSGHTEEALAALQFIMNGQCGKYKNFSWQGNSVGIGQDYAVSVFRYTGNGSEESEQTDDGIVIELEGLGLTLWNLRQYIEKTEDVKFLIYYWQKISNQIADVLTNSIDQTGLVRADCGLWVGQAPEKHYLFTSACIYNGLVSASLMARFVNDQNRIMQYEDAANSLRMSIEKNLYDETENTLKGNAEDKNPYIYMDASAVEALNWIYNSQDKITKGTLAAFDKYLLMKNPNHGYRRTLGDEWQDRQEWMFGDLRILANYQRIPNSPRAADLRKWIVYQSLNNYGLIPQYYDENNSSYQGVVPQCGLGAGAYILSLWGE